MEACILCREKYPGDGDRCEENRKPVPDEPGEAAKVTAQAAEKPLSSASLYARRLTDDASRVTMQQASLSHQMGTGCTPRTPKDTKRSTPVMLMRPAAAVEAANSSAAAVSRATEC